MPIVYEDMQDCKAAVFGEMSSGIINFIDAQVSRGIDHLSEATRNIYANAFTAYNSFIDSSAMRKMIAAKNTAEHFLDSDIFRSATLLRELQQSKHKMQRGIMASPILRELSRENRIEGYRDEYIDKYPQLDPKEHPDYRRVISGIWVDSENGDEGDITYSYDLYSDLYNVEDAEDPFNNLTIVEQDWILSAQAAAIRYFKAGKDDPTSKWNSSL